MSTLRVTHSPRAFRSGVLPHLIGHAVGTCSIEKKPIAFVFGGKVSDSGTMSNDLYLIDLINKHCVKVLSSGTAPSPRYEHALAVVSSSSPSGVIIYVFGGRSTITSSQAPLYELFLSDQSILTFLSNSTPASLPLWKSTTSGIGGSWPSDRFGHSLVQISNDYLLLSGGLTGYGSSLRLTTDAFLFHRHSRIWTSVFQEICPTLSRAYAGVCSLYPYKQSILIVGGCRVGDQCEAVSFNDAVYVSLTGKSLTTSAVPLTIKPSFTALMRSSLVMLPNSDPKNKPFLFVSTGGVTQDQQQPFCQLSLLSLSPKSPAFVTLEHTYGSFTERISSSDSKLVVGRERHVVCFSHSMSSTSHCLLILGGRMHSTSSPASLALTLNYVSSNLSSVSSLSLSSRSPPSSPSPSPSSSPLPLDTYDTPKALKVEDLTSDSPLATPGSSRRVTRPSTGRKQREFYQVNWHGTPSEICKSPYFSNSQVSSSSFGFDSQYADFSDSDDFNCPIAKSHATALIEFLHDRMDSGSWVGRTLVIPRSQLAKFKDLTLHVFKYAKNIIEKEPIILEVAAPSYVLGDLHGNMLDLSFLRSMLWPRGVSFTAGNFVLLGDYVDRGPNPLEVVAYVLACKILYPNQWFILRGNHESTGQNAIRGPRTTFDVLIQSFNDDDTKELLDSMNSVFDHLPLIAIVTEVSTNRISKPRRVFCCHGGIPRPINNSWPETWRLIQSTVRPFDLNTVNIDELPTIERNQMTLASELMWNDIKTDLSMSCSSSGFGPSSRGEGCYTFDATVVKSFCSSLGFSAMIRGHQATSQGVEVGGTPEFPVLTVFSTSRDHFATSMRQNLCGCVLVSGKGEVQSISGEVTFPRITHSIPRPISVPDANRIVVGFTGSSFYNDNSALFNAICNAVSRHDPHQAGFKRVELNNVVLPLIDIYATPDKISKTNLSKISGILQNNGPLSQLLLTAKDLSVDFSGISVVINVTLSCIETLDTLRYQINQNLTVDVEPRKNFEVVLFSRNGGTETSETWGISMYNEATKQIQSQFSADKLTLKLNNPKLVYLSGDRVEILNV
ncbi:hypothetical protein RCL1_006415 [Eukaryota sp. TZLM3-RCL]